MARILVYNPSTNRMEVYYRGLSESMPYAQHLTVGEFRANSRTDTLWTDKRFMQAWNALRNAYGKPIPVGYAFKRIGEGGHTAMSEHYAGIAMDIGQALTSAERDDVRNLASRLGVFTYIEPKVLTPTWIHIDKRFGIPACSGGGFPTVSYGSKGVYVATLQDALGTLGYSTGTIDGIFGAGTRDAVMRFQRANGLPTDGVVGCNTWERIVNKANGAGF